MLADTSQRWASAVDVIHWKPMSGTSRPPTMETRERNSASLLYKPQHPVNRIYHRVTTKANSRRARRTATVQSCRRAAVLILPPMTVFSPVKCAMNVTFLPVVRVSHLAFEIPLIFGFAYGSSDCICIALTLCDLSAIFYRILGRICAVAQYQQLLLK
jgi:hypothetical protein